MNDSEMTLKANLRFDSRIQCAMLTRSMSMFDASNSATAAIIYAPCKTDKTGRTTRLRQGFAVKRDTQEKDVKLDEWLSFCDPIH